MIQKPFLPLRKHPAFREVSDASLSKLEGSCSVLRFDLGGQLLNQTKSRRNSCHSPRARQACRRHNGRLTTVGKVGPGSVVGAASLLGAPCENVIAAEEVIAYAISDELWRELYSKKPRFVIGAISNFGPRNS